MDFEGGQSVNLHDCSIVPATSGTRRPCPDVGGGEIDPGFAMPIWAKRASHIDPPTSSHAIMRRARPYRGENREPGKDKRRRERDIRITAAASIVWLHDPTD